MPRERKKREKFAEQAHKFSFLVSFLLSPPKNSPTLVFRAFSQSYHLGSYLSCLVHSTLKVQSLSVDCPFWNQPCQTFRWIAQIQIQNASRLLLNTMHLARKPPQTNLSRLQPINHPIYICLTLATRLGAPNAAQVLRS